MKLESVIAANRFGLGAKSGELSVIDKNPRRWLLDQLQGPSRLPDDLADLPSSASVFTEFRKVRNMKRESQRSDSDKPAPDFSQIYGEMVRSNYIDQVNARYRTATASEQPFYERLVHFWSNHFALSADKRPIRATAGLFENEAIRPNVAGKFADLLIAAEQHAAMIQYLDNERSIGPGSKFGKHPSRHKQDRRFGLNENLAREILELHTLGVNGGYTQQDVTSFAKVITGWSVGGDGVNGVFSEGVPGTFTFHDAIHEPGTHRVLGKNYSPCGVKQGEAVLRDLATHPSTARFVVRKLVRHFVADHPPDLLVNKLTSVFLSSNGDLPTVYESLIQSVDPWSATFAKYKTPHDFVISAYRAFNHKPANPRFTLAALELMGQTPFRPGSPQGWPDTALQWGGADALMKRIEWSTAIARAVGNRHNPAELGDAILGPAFDADTRKAIARAESKMQGTTLFLASPEFQRR